MSRMFRYLFWKTSEMLRWPLTWPWRTRRRWSCRPGWGPWSGWAPGRSHAHGIPAEEGSPPWRVVSARRCWCDRYRPHLGGEVKGQCQHMLSVTLLMNYTTKLSVSNAALDSLNQSNEMSLFQFSFYF